MVDAYLSIGSNLGDRASHLRAAIAALREIGKVIANSSFYETEPQEFTGQPWFLNCVVAFGSDLSAEELLQWLLVIEKNMGRDRSREEQRKGPRVVDLDILLYGTLVSDTPELTIPHPAMHLRRFVLVPLAEIAPTVEHPLLKQNAREMLQTLPESGAVVRLFREK